MVIPGSFGRRCPGEDVTVYGDGEQRRAPSATCRMPVVALVALLDHAGAVGDVVNVGATNDVSINELARR
jgi:UDP-glucose 4-epimerase